MDRLSVLSKHLTPSPAPSNPEGIARGDVNASMEEDIVIVSALRTPIGKARRGSFKDTKPDQLLSAVFKATFEKTGLDPKLVGDMVIGTVNQPMGGAAQARMAQFNSGIPYSVPVCTLNRQCSSGLQAVMNIAGSIRNGSIDVGLAAGVESMSIDVTAKQLGAEDISSELFDCALARDCMIPMGMTSENVAEKFGVTRAEQDHLSMLSHQKAAKAQETGLFDAEIVPVTTKVIGPDGTEKTITVTKDEGIRANTTVEGLAKLRAAFKEGGTTTAGNSSQVSDGAAAVLLMRRSVAEKLGMPILGRVVSYAVEGVLPDVMGIGPAVAIPSALAKAGLSKDQIDIYEINEAFASQALYCIKELGLPLEKVNPKGGAIALGHPLGCTGARQVGTLLHELRRTGKKYGVCSMCIGTGMGAAAVFEAC